MAIIHKPNNQPLDLAGVMGVPAWMVPSARICKAQEFHAQGHILIKAHGGVGDVICSEPAIRYACENFRKHGSRISLLTPYPELFRHLEFDEVWSNMHDEPVKCLKGGKTPPIDLNQYLMFQTIDVTNELGNEFVCHALMSGVDYAALNMWRLILPNSYKRIQLYPNAEEYAKAGALHQDNDVVLHPGRTWKSRTFPKKWWDAIIQGLVERKARPVLIGGSVDKGRATTVDVSTEGCLDLRYKQTLMETVALLHLSKVLVTNDSSPNHMAVTGNTWIGVLSTVKHMDHLTHWRRPGPQELCGDHDLYGWRQHDLALGGLHKELNIAPNNPTTVSVDECSVPQLLSWLPEPESVVDWCLERL